MGVGLFCHETSDIVIGNGLNLHERSSRMDIGKNFFRGCPSLAQAARGWSHHCRRDLKDVKMWHLGTWLSGVLSSAILKGGLEDLRGLSQPSCFWDGAIQ